MSHVTEAKSRYRRQTIHNFYILVVMNNELYACSHDWYVCHWNEKFSNSIQSISLFWHIGPIQNTHINIDTRKNNQPICSREYIMLSRDHAVHINSTITSISFLSKFGIDHCCSLILSSGDNKAAWPLSSSVRSFFFRPVIYQHTFDSLTSVNYKNEHWEPTNKLRDFHLTYKLQRMFLTFQRADILYDLFVL